MSLSVVVCWQSLMFALHLTNEECRVCACSEIEPLFGTNAEHTRRKLCRGDDDEYSSRVGIQRWTIHQSAAHSFMSASRLLLVTCLHLLHCVYVWSNCLSRTLIPHQYYFHGLGGAFEPVDGRFMHTILMFSNTYPKNLVSCPGVLFTRQCRLRDGEGTELSAGVIFCENETLLLGPMTDDLSSLYKKAVPESHTRDFACVSCILVADFSGTRNLYVLGSHFIMH